MVNHIDDDIAETIPTRQRKAQPINWDRVPAFNSILHRDALLAYMRALPDTVAARVWITDALGTEDLGLSRACDLLDPILPCFVTRPRRTPADPGRDPRPHHALRRHDHRPGIRATHAGTRRSEATTTHSEGRSKLR